MLGIIDFLQSRFVFGDCLLPVDKIGEFCRTFDICLDVFKVGFDGSQDAPLWIAQAADNVPHRGYVILGYPQKMLAYSYCPGADNRFSKEKRPGG